MRRVHDHARDETKKKTWFRRSNKKEEWKVHAKWKTANRCLAQIKLENMKIYRFLGTRKASTEYYLFGSIHFQRLNRVAHVVVWRQTEQNRDSATHTVEIVHDSIRSFFFGQFSDDVNYYDCHSHTRRTHFKSQLIASSNCILSYDLLIINQLE